MKKITPVRDFIKGVSASVTDSANVEIIGSSRVVIEETNKLELTE